MDVAISVVNWNQPAMTEECLLSILALSELKSYDIEVVLVCIDNGSTDGSGDRLAQFVRSINDNRLELHCSPVNLGYAGGHNIALRSAAKRFSPNFFWILNNDTRPRQGSLRALMECAASNPRAGIIGSTLIEKSTGRVECAGGSRYYPCFGYAKGLWRGSRPNALPPCTTRNPDYIGGASMFVRSTVMSQANFFSEDYFLYFEELDLARRVGQSCELVWCPKSLVEHAGGASMPGPTGRAKAVYYSTRSALLFTARWHPMCLPTVALTRILVKPLTYLATGQSYLFTPFMQAFLDFMRRR